MTVLRIARSWSLQKQAESSFNSSIDDQNLSEVIAQSQCIRCCTHSPSSHSRIKMSGWKSNLIDAYRLASWPMRQVYLNRLRKSGNVPVLIVFYHRVDNTNLNPWTITEEAFQEQIDWYEKNFDLVDLEECQRRILRGQNDRPTLSITFDDGYADNSTFALPMLISRGIPVTYFVTTRHTTTGDPFPHDVERGIPLTPNSVDSLIALAKAGVEIGGHTRNHSDLGKVQDADELFDEVIEASRELERLIDKPIRYFACPFGLHENLNADAFQLLKQHGFKGVCSAYGGYNFVGGDAFHLQRLHGDPNFSRMKNWLTFDPRMMKPNPYDYQSKASFHLPADLAELTSQVVAPLSDSNCNE